MRLWGIFVVLMMISAMVPMSEAIQVTDPDVAAIWLFDEPVKEEAKDISKYGHVGKIHGNVEWTEEGKFGGAMLFKGNVSWIEVPDHPSLQFPKGQDFTIAAYVKTEMSSGNPPMIVAKNYQPSETRPWYALYYANQAKQLDGHVSFFLRNAAGQSFHIASKSTINDGEWHHIAGVREGGTIRLYVDGEEEASMDGADCDVGTNPAPLHINGHLNRWLVGAFDEIILIRRALTKGEIRSLVDGGIASIFLDVSKKGKLAITWGQVKRGF
ncbi:LamG domain-containing protein [Candidatus Poribacteria bacterium]|nr:LamG domain-containing protein [Candidatus Poribacteria bacterium]